MLDKSYAIVITTQVYCSCQEVERNGSFINWVRSLWEEPNCFNKSICMVVLTLHFLLNYTMIKCWQISVSVTYTCLPSLTPSWIRWFMQNLAKIKRLTKVTIMNHWRLYQGGATIVTRTYNEIYSTMERCEFLFQNKTTALKKKTARILHVCFDPQIQYSEKQHCMRCIWILKSKLIIQL